MKICIVGGGLTGMLNALKYVNKGHDITLVEKQPSLGGLIKTYKYSYNNDDYYFDIGPHLPPNNSEDWSSIFDDIKYHDILGILPLILKFKSFFLSYPISFKKIKLGFYPKVIRIGLSFIIAKIFKKEENCLENKLINAWGAYFYKKFLREYIMHFWSLPVSDISINYDNRLKPPAFSKIIKDKFSVSKTKKNEQNEPSSSKKTNCEYPEFGFGDIIVSLEQKLKKNGIKVLLNSSIQQLNFDEKNQKTEIVFESPKTQKGSFDFIIWTGSMVDLANTIPNFKQYPLKYMNLLILNYAIDQNNVLGSNYHCAYTMIPDISFHRLYEPNKLSEIMAPNGKSSICIEHTYFDKIENLDDLITKITRDFSQIFKIPLEKIKLLGTESIENAYPFLYNGYDVDYDKYMEELKQKIPNLFLIGRLGVYRSTDVRVALNSLHTDYF